MADNFTQRDKGQSLLTFPSDFTVIDLETTGFAPTTADIIEVACVKVRSGKEVERFSTLVQPVCGAIVPSFITELTGITSEMLEEAPCFEEIAEEVWTFLRGETLVGHNVNFDVNFLYDEFRASGFGPLRNDFVDTCRLARHILPELSRRRLVDLCEFYGIETVYHRALADCDSTRQILARLHETALARSVAFPLF